MSQQVDHPQRYATVNELHARPFPSLTVPCEAVYLAFKEPEQAASHCVSFIGQLLLIVTKQTHDMNVSWVCLVT